jgi:hypothetical protein
MGLKICKSDLKNYVKFLVWSTIRNTYKYKYIYINNNKLKNKKLI